MEARWGLTPHSLPRRQKLLHPKTHMAPKGTTERQGCAGGRKHGLGVSQDKICSPSELERTSEGRGLLDKASRPSPTHNIMLYRDPSLWRCPVSEGRPRERKAFLSLSGIRGECRTPGWLASGQPPPLSSLKARCAPSSWR